MSDHGEVPGNETISHFAFQESDYYKDGKERLKHSAFMSSKVPGEVSVFRINTLTEPEIWDIGDTLRSDKQAKARGDMLVADIVAIKNEQENTLRVIEAIIPNFLHGELHANIINIPIDDKTKQRTVAALISEKTILKVKP